MLIFGSGEFGIWGAILCLTGTLFLLISGGMFFIRTLGVRMLLSPAMLMRYGMGDNNRLKRTVGIIPGLVQIILASIMGTLFTIGLVIPGLVIYAFAYLISDDVPTAFVVALIFYYLMQLNQRPPAPREQPDAVPVQEQPSPLLDLIPGTLIGIVAFAISGYLFGDFVGAMAAIWWMQTGIMYLRLRRGVAILPRSLQAQRIFVMGGNRDMPPHPEGGMPADNVPGSELPYRPTDDDDEEPMIIEGTPPRE